MGFKNSERESGRSYLVRINSVAKRSHRKRDDYKKRRISAFDMPDIPSVLDMTSQISCATTDNSFFMTFRFVTTSILKLSRALWGLRTENGRN